jgi:Holliday junction resolvasome RuvABC ATP-dependent DNA helicase subunit
VQQLADLALANAKTLGFEADYEAMEMFASASRGVPRQINNYVKNALSLAEGERLTVDVADRVLRDLNGVTLDGLTPDMQAFLIFLLTKSKRTMASGEVRYQASVGTIATAIGKSRDDKALRLRVEPWLIEQGLIQIIPGGRMLTDAGIKRAQQLLEQS